MTTNVAILQAAKTIFIIMPNSHSLRDRSKEKLLQSPTSTSHLSSSILFPTQMASFPFWCTLCTPLPFELECCRSPIHPHSLKLPFIRKSLTHTHTHIHTHTCTHSFYVPLTHTYKLSNTHSLSLSLTHTRMHKTHTHALSLSLTHTHTLSLFRSFFALLLGSFQLLDLQDVWHPWSNKGKY